jgi:hypothetical protein
MQVMLMKNSFATKSLFFTSLALLGSGGLLIIYKHILTGWIMTILATCTMMAGIGLLINNCKMGVFITPQNVLSLSRLQMSAWTCLILSALFAAAISNLSFSFDSALNIEIPENLLWLMGISTTSLIGSPLISNSKARTPANSNEAKENLSLKAQQSDLNVSQVNATGQLQGYSSPSCATWSDLFSGVEVGNTQVVDLSRVQMAYVTALILSVYAIMLGGKFYSNTGQYVALPDINAYMVGLIAISHAGYLTLKAIPNSLPADSKTNPKQVP